MGKGGWVVGLLMVAVLMAAGSFYQQAAGGRRDGVEILRFTREAEKKINYTGLESVETASRWQRQASLRVFHKAASGTRREFLFPTHMAGTILLDIEGEQWMYRPRSQRWQPAWNESGQEDIDLLLRNYKVSLKGYEEVAGRRCYVLSVDPVYPGNPSKILWVDVTRSIILRSELRSASGALMTRSVFTSIHYDKKISSLLFEIPEVERQEVRKVVRKPPFAVLRPSYLPKGYVFAGVAPHQFQGKNVVHLKYTDGLNTISLFEERADDSDSPGGQYRRRSRRGSRFPRYLSWEQNSLRLTLMGDISPDEMRKMAASIPGAEKALEERNAFNRGT